ncbi:ferritin-like domain-containing protein, partial [Ramlibacter sp.]|uniref:ferritin-like domain-containing protein n=1 Tax=Ramlibacter sp. TaxID=1917967 RepID=UPI0017BC14DB
MTQAAVLQNAARLFTPNDAALLQQHLQALVTVEFLTIPLYLTAVYSFTEAALAWSPDGGKTTPLYAAQQEVLSVAVQEMLHLQLAGNMCNSFGVTPQIPQLNVAPGEVITVPHLEPTAGTPLTTTIGNLPAVMEALIAIEKPAGSDFPPPNPQVVYQSIADLYHATLTLLSRYMRAYANVSPGDDPHFQPDHLQVNYATFASTYPMIPTISTRTDVGTVANAITDQGEGGLVASTVGGLFRSGADGEVLPQFQPVKGSRFARWGAKTHYTRFVDVKAVIDQIAALDKTPMVHAADDPRLPGNASMFYQPNGVQSPDLPSWAPRAPVLQGCASTIWSYLIDAMQQGFAGGTLSPNSGQTATSPGFNDAMLAFKYVTPLVWQYGQVIGYQYTAGVTGAQAAQAMDTADPLSLFHWDETTANLRAQWTADGVALNACQGLNTCSGRGWGGIATAAGNGACATADLHTCGGGNDCGAQGGCGFLSSVQGGGLLGPADQWIPSENIGAGTGGCQTPISTLQMFDSGATATINAQTGEGWTDAAKAALVALEGTSVWQQARKLFAARQGSALPQPLASGA